MSEVVNLRRMRKAKAKEEASLKADANRIKHGISKRERDIAETASNKAARDLDVHKLEREN